MYPTYARRASMTKRLAVRVAPLHIGLRPLGSGSQGKFTEAFSRPALGQRREGFLASLPRRRRWIERLSVRSNRQKRPKRAGNAC